MIELMTSLVDGLEVEPYTTSFRYPTVGAPWYPRSLASGGQPKERPSEELDLTRF
jgi:hypothetical protein